MPSDEDNGAEKERLSNSEFNELIPHLPVQDLLQIEYRVLKWNRFFTLIDASKKLYRCGVCGVSQFGVKNLISHIDGKKHKIKAQSIKQFYHPSYTYGKHQVALALGTDRGKSRSGVSKATSKKSISITPKGSASSIKAINVATGGLVASTVSSKQISDIANYCEVDTKAAGAGKTDKSVSSAIKKTTVQSNKVGTIPVSQHRDLISENLTGFDKTKITTSNVANNTTVSLKTEPKTESSKSNNSASATGKPVKNITQKNQKTTDSAEIHASVNVPTKSSAVVVEVKIPKAKPVQNISALNQNSNALLKPDPGKENPTTNIVIKSATNLEKAKNKCQENVLNTKRTAPVTVISQKPNITQKKPTANVTYIGSESTKHNSSKFEPDQNIVEANDKSSKAAETILHKSPQKKPIINVTPISKLMQKQNLPISNTTRATETSSALKEFKDKDQKGKCINKGENVNATKCTDAVKPKLVTSTNQSVINDISTEAVEFAELIEQNDNYADEHNLPTMIVRNPFSASKRHLTHSEPEKNENNDKIVSANQTSGNDLAEVIVIDDDKHSNLEEDDALDNDNGNKVQSSIKRRLEKSMKEVITDATNVKDEPLPKRQKIVLNPAATLQEQITESNKSKRNALKYQTNLVIIPTVDKNKAKEIPKNLTAYQPQFSMKIFSAKPNDDDVQGLIGVEYVVKILKHRQDQSPKYECGLCELVLDGSAMQNHLTGYNHRLKFCEKHFPTAVRQYRQFMGKIPQHEIFKVLAPVLAKLALAIEQHHGRDLPHECLEREFNINRHEILSKAYSCRHASEQYGPTFTHVVDSKEIDELIASRHTYKPHSSQVALFDMRPGGSHFRQARKTSPPRREQHRYPQMLENTHSILSQFGMYQPYVTPMQFGMPYQPNSEVEPATLLDNETHKQLVENFLRDTGKSSTRSHIITANSRYDRQRRYGRSDDRYRNRLRSRSRSRSRTNTRFQKGTRRSISPLRENDIWQAYRHMVDQKVLEIDKLFKLYKKDPETHPMYNEEWQKFWRRRKDELITSGLDHRTYNYQPEWVRFFEVRVDELYTQEVENIKIQSRERLCLPMTNDDLADSKYHINVLRSSTAMEEVEPNVCEDMTEKELNRRNDEFGNTKSHKVISVLRLMAALEEYLGSLGPKIIHLMVKALQVEKTDPNDITTIILTNDNCALLETAMEKFKGLVLSGIVDKPKERALRKAIQDVESLLQSSENERKKSSQRFIPDKQNALADTLPRPVPSPVCTTIKQQTPVTITQMSVPLSSNASERRMQNSSATVNPNTSISNLLAMADKKELATKLAAALAAQGKTDFDPEQLQQLIAVYTIIEKKKREAAVASKPEVATVATNMINRKSLSATLTDFLNPVTQQEESKALPKNNQTYNAKTISNYVDMMRRTTEVHFADSGDNCQQPNKGANERRYTQNYGGNMTSMNQNKGMESNLVRSTVNVSNPNLNITNFTDDTMHYGYQYGTDDNNFEPTTSSGRTMNANRSIFCNTNNNSMRMNSNNNNIGQQHQHHHLHQANSTAHNQNHSQDGNGNQNRNQYWAPTGRGPNRGEVVEGNMNNTSGDFNPNSSSNWRRS